MFGVIVNPVSGGGEAAGLAVQITERIAALGEESRIFETGGDGDAASAAGMSASGGVFNHPYLTWVAEAGYPEVIVPITHDANAYNLWATAGQMLGVGPAAMPAMPNVPAAAPSSGGPVEINFAPTINVQGGPGNEQAISRLMDQKMREFDRMMKRWTAEKRRLSYE